MVGHRTRPKTALTRLRKLLEDKLKKKQKVPGFVETPLFIYDFMQ